MLIGYMENNIRRALRPKTANLNCNRYPKGCKIKHKEGCLKQNKNTSKLNYSNNKDLICSETSKDLLKSNNPRAQKSVLSPSSKDPIVFKDKSRNKYQTVNNSLVQIDEEMPKRNNSKEHSTPSRNKTRVKSGSWIKSTLKSGKGTKLLKKLNSKEFERDFSKIKEHLESIQYSYLHIN